MASLKIRGKKYYAQYYLAGSQKRVALDTDSYQVAKEKLRQIESSLLRGSHLPLPTKTLLPEILTAYVDHISVTKTPRSVRSDVYYLREMFGAICPAVTVTSRRTTEKARKRPLRPRKRHVPHNLEVNCLEEITTAQISTYISAVVRARGLAPKTANRYREILCRIFNWAIQQRGIRTPDSRAGLSSPAPRHLA